MGTKRILVKIPRKRLLRKRPTKAKLIFFHERTLGRRTPRKRLIRERLLKIKIKGRIPKRRTPRRKTYVKVQRKTCEIIQRRIHKRKTPIRKMCVKIPTERIHRRK